MFGYFWGQEPVPRCIDFTCLNWALSMCEATLRVPGLDLGYCQPASLFQGLGSVGFIGFIGFVGLIGLIGFIGFRD